MPLTLVESQTISALADLLYNFLPGSGNNTTSFPIAAHKAGVPENWNLVGSKGPAIQHLLASVYEMRRSRFCPLIIHVVELSLAYRGRRDPLSRSEVDQLNSLLADLEFRIPELSDPKFLARLAGSPFPEEVHEAAERRDPKIPSKKTVEELGRTLLALSSLGPQERGFAFEKFLNAMFSAFGMEPRESFRLRGEQIDGSFIHRHDTFLLEAKWQTKEVVVQALWAFASRVETKSVFGRGLFISESGFTEDGLFAFRQGKPTSLVCMDGFDLYSVLERGLSLEDVLDRKKRRAAETGLAFVSVRDIYA